MQLPFQTAPHRNQGLSGVLAVTDAKKRGTPLDRPSGDERNPSQKIDEYLRYSELTQRLPTGSPKSLCSSYMLITNDTVGLENAQTPDC